MEYYEGIIPPQNKSKKKKIIAWITAGATVSGLMMFVLFSVSAKAFIKSGALVIGQSLKDALGISHEGIVQDIALEDQNDVSSAATSTDNFQKTTNAKKTSSKKKTVSVTKKNNMLPSANLLQHGITPVIASDTYNESTTKGIAVANSNDPVVESLTKESAINYEVNLSISGDGRGIVTSTPSGIACEQTCSWNFSKGEILKLHASHDSASAFDGWSGACYGKSGDCAITVNGYISIGASFHATGYEPIITESSSNNNGSDTGAINNSGPVAATSSESTESPVSTPDMPASSTPTNSGVGHIVVADVEIAGQSSANDFVKIFNPTEEAVDVSGWKLHKKSSTGTDYSLKEFPKGSIVGPGSYFTWANSQNDFADSMEADVSSSETLSADNSVALLNASGTIIDQVAWGNGVNQYVENMPYPTNPTQGKILTRVNHSGYLVDTDDNAEDFTLQ